MATVPRLVSYYTSASFSLPPELLTILKAEARRRDMTFSQLIRHCVHHTLREADDGTAANFSAE